jgi:hypothetical protein
VCRRPKILRIVLWLIISNWFISNIPTSVFVFGASSTNPGPYLKLYGIWERLQLSLYFVQELAISGLYVYEVVGMLRPDSGALLPENKRESIFSRHRLGRRWRSDSSRLVLKHLIWINITIIVLDVSLLVTEYIGHYEIQVVYKVCFLPRTHSCEVQCTNLKILKGIRLFGQVEARIQDTEPINGYCLRRNEIESSVLQQPEPVARKRMLQSPSNYL